MRYPALDLKIDRLNYVKKHASGFNGLSITNICVGEVLLIGTTAVEYSVSVFFTLHRNRQFFLPLNSNTKRVETSHPNLNISLALSVTSDRTFNRSVFWMSSLLIVFCTHFEIKHQLTYV
jgi:hypothetical protein